MYPKINKDVDLKILLDLSLGMPQKVIATKYNVSASYVSKVACGKKGVQLYEDVELDDPDMRELLMSILTHEEHIDVNTYIESQIQLHLRKLKIYLKIKETLPVIKEEINGRR